LFDKGAYIFNFNDLSYRSTGLFTDLAVNTSNQSTIVPDITLFKTGYNFLVPAAGSPNYDGLYTTVASQSNVLAITNGYNFTIATWFKPTVSSPGQVIIAAAPSGDGGANKIRTDVSNNVCVQLDQANTMYFCSTSKVEVGKWYYIVAVFKDLGSSNLEVSLYVDGKLFKNTFTGVSPSTTNGFLLVGADCCFNSVGLYDEVVLSDITF
jgi:hypothetical protein